MQKKLTWQNVNDIVNLHKGRNLTYIELYKKFFMRVMDRQIKLDKKEDTKWMSNISSPILYMLTMAVYGMYQDSKVAFEVYKKIKIAKSEWLDDTEQAEYKKQVEEANNISNNLIDLFESIYEACDWSEEFDLSVLDAIILGNGFGWIWYDKSEETYEVMNPKTTLKDKITEKINIPTTFRIVPLNFYTEVSANSQKKAKINMVRKILTAETINKNYKVYGVNYIEDTSKTPTLLESKDWNMVLRFLIFNNMPFITTLKSLGWAKTISGVESTAWDLAAIHTDIWSDNNYGIWKDLHEVYEIHTNETIQIFVDWEDLWMFSRLGPWKEKPIYKIAFRDGLNGLYDMWVGTIGYNFHKVVDGFLNLRIDNDRLAASAPMVVNADDNYFEGMDYLQQHPGKLIKVKDVNQWPKPIQYNGNQWGIANSEVNMLWKTVQDAVGVSWYKMGIQQKVERAAKWVSELVEAADASMKSFISSIAKAKWFIAKYVTLLALYYMDDETIFKMCGNKELKKSVDISDFVKDYSFNYNIQSVSSLRERQELEIIKGIIRDYAWAVRPDGTPVMNQEAGFRMIIEKSWAPEDLLLTGEKALEYMKKQIQNNAELKKLEVESMPQQPWVPSPGGEATPPTVWAATPMEIPWGIIPPVGVQPAPKIWAVPAPGIQWGSLGEWMAQPTNILWINQQPWGIG